MIYRIRHVFSVAIASSCTLKSVYFCRGRTNIKCIVFVKRIIAAKSLARILGNLKALEFWKCEFLVGFHSRSVTRKGMNGIVEKFSSGEVIKTVLLDAKPQ